MNGLQTSDGAATGFHEIVNNEIHHNGAEELHDHGIYLGDGSPNVLIEGNHIHNNCAFGIQFNGDAGGHIARNNIIHDNDECGAGTNAGGFWIGGGTDNNKIYNNLIYNEPQGMDLKSGSGNEIYNNTFYAGDSNDFGILVDTGQSGSTLRNNIIYNPTGSSLIANGSSITYSNNLCRTGTTGCAMTGSPGFVTAGSDFHLLGSSQAVDAGFDLSAVFTTDIEGTTRDSDFDLGAYEFVQADTTDPVVTITAPTSNTTYATATTPITTIAGTATDAVGTTSVTWANAATSGSGSASGCSGQTSCNWSVSSIALNEGSNAITITGADAASNDGTDTITVTLDSTAPSRSSGSPSGTLAAGTTSTSISLTTNETATCKYGTTASVAYASQPNTFSSTNSTSHSTTVGSLSDGNSYTYYVRCQDALNNANTSDFSISFSVNARPSRSNGSPSGALASGTTSTSISLTTNETATCKYGTSAGVAYASQPNTFSTTNSTSHSTTVSGLSDGNSYAYYVRCQDTFGDPNTDDFTISFSIDEPSVALPGVPTSLSDSASAMPTMPGVPTSLSDSANATPTLPGNPTSLSDSASATPSMPGVPTDLSF